MAEPNSLAISAMGMAQMMGTASSNSKVSPGPDEAIIKLFNRPLKRER